MFVQVQLITLLNEFTFGEEKVRCDSTKKILKLFRRYGHLKLFCSALIELYS